MDLPMHAVVASVISIDHIVYNLKFLRRLECC